MISSIMSTYSGENFGFRQMMYETYNLLDNLQYIIAKFELDVHFT